MNDIIRQIENGSVFADLKNYKIEKMEWNAHPLYKDVFLKHLVKGVNTNGKFSCHLVRVGPECEISSHIHESKWELHEVIGGSGKGFIMDKEIPYIPGSISVIPEGTEHKVMASKEGLILFAKFIPALLIILYSFAII